MGWDEWCEGGMAGSTKCGIYDTKGTNWGAKPDDFKKNLPAPFVNAVNSLFSKGMECGIGKLELDGIKFMILRVDGDVIVGKQGGDKGITIAKSKTAIVVGYFDGSNKTMNPGINRNAVETIKNGLENAGY